MVGQQEPMVTGDAVVLDVQIAHLPVRALSALIDVIVVLTFYIIGVLLWATTLTQFDSALSAAVLIIFTVVTLLAYPIAFETATRGRSLGKMALGLRVVSDDGGPERFRQAVFRALAGFVEIWALSGGPAVICSLLSPTGKRLGDVFAGTVVISERAPRLTPPPLMPPQLAWWASTLQLSGLRAEQAELARQFLSRASQLDPMVRDQMAHRIAGDVVAQYPRPRHPASRRSLSSRPYWPSGTVVSWPGCNRSPWPRRRNGPRPADNSRHTNSPLPRHRRRSSPIPGDSSHRSSGSARRSAARPPR